MKATQLPAAELSDDDLRQTIRELAHRVAEMETRLSEKSGAPLGFSDDKLATIARSIYRTRQRRTHYFDPSLFGEPAWDMLIDLFIAKIRGARVSSTSLCLAAGVPQATGLRWIQILEGQGLLRRFRAPDDGRLMLIEITAQAYHLMRKCVGEAVTKFEWPVPG
jgi:hypothetical protein